MNTKEYPIVKCAWCGTEIDTYTEGYALNSEGEIVCGGDCNFDEPDDSYGYFDQKNFD